MRKRDWADAIADEFYDIIVDSDGDDQKVIDRIGTELRKAFLDGLEQKQRGVIVDEAGNGDRSLYVATARRNEPERIVAANSQVITSCRGCKLTWNGQRSERKDG